jgi:hypothetical protein
MATTRRSSEDEAEFLKQQIKGGIMKNIWVIVGVVVLVVFLIMSGKIFEYNDVQDIMAIQPVANVGGKAEVAWYDTNGVKIQNFGAVTIFPKRAQFWFSNKNDQGQTGDQSIKIRFNDGGHGNISGSLAWEMPKDAAKRNALLANYGTYENIQHQLIRTVVEKAVYMTGPLMSSKESYAEKRNLLLSYIEDQIQYGIYQTDTEQVKTTDPMTGKEKTVSVVKLIKDAKAPNGIARVDDSPISANGIKTSNLSINEVKYDKEVEAQIKTQQDAIMQVQTAMAKAKEAEQAAITAEKTGQAGAAKAKWDQEIIRATAIVKAQQGKDVAKLDMEAAEFSKKKLILEGEGEAAKKRLIMQADGALEMKTKAYVEVMKVAYAEMGKQKWVSEINMGGNSPQGATAMNSMMDIFNMRTMRDLGLDMGIKYGAGQAAPAAPKAHK